MDSHLLTGRGEVGHEKPALDLDALALRCHGRGGHEARRRLSVKVTERRSLPTCSKASPSTPRSNSRDRRIGNASIPEIRRPGSRVYRGETLGERIERPDSRVELIEQRASLFCETELQRGAPLTHADELEPSQVRDFSWSPSRTDGCLTFRGKPKARYGNPEVGGQVLEHIEPNPSGARGWPRNRDAQDGIDLVRRNAPPP